MVRPEQAVDGFVGETFMVENHVNFARERTERVVVELDHSNSLTVLIRASVVATS